MRRPRCGRSGSDSILTRRLKDIYWPAWVDAIARDRRIDRVRPLAEYRAMPRDRFYDIKRVRFFLEVLRAGRAVDPIVVDNDVRQPCLGSPVYWGTPFVDDGHHRFIAHVLLERDWMPAQLSGLVIHHEWLRGERDDFVDPNT